MRNSARGSSSAFVARRSSSRPSPRPSGRARRRRAVVAGSRAARGKLEQIARFTFPRQSEREGLCLSDYFLPAETSRFDVLPLQIVTVGPYADELQQALDRRGEYAEALFVHGLAVSAAEGLAEWSHQRIRRELGLEPEQG